MISPTVISTHLSSIETSLSPENNGTSTKPVSLLTLFSNIKDLALLKSLPPLSDKSSSSLCSKAGQCRISTSLFELEARNPCFFVFRSTWMRHLILYPGKEEYWGGSKGGRVSYFPILFIVSFTISSFMKAESLSPTIWKSQPPHSP